MQLLAKALKEEKVTSPGETLSGHTYMVLTAFKAMFGTPETPSHLTLQWLAFFKLSQEHLAGFWLHTLVACALHDIGKANEDFQKLVTRSLNGAQRIRHEHFSGLLLYLPECKAWLESIPNLDLKVIFSAVVGHHLKIKFEEFAVPQGAVNSLIKVYPEGIVKIFQLLASELKMVKPSFQIPDLWAAEDSLYGEDISALKEEIGNEILKYQRQLKKNPEQMAFLNAVRTALILADSAGSGLSREMRNEGRMAQAITDWLKAVFETEQLQTAEDIDQKVITPRIRSIKAAGKTFIWKDFQKAYPFTPPPHHRLQPEISEGLTPKPRWA